MRNCSECISPFDQQIISKYVRLSCKSSKCSNPNRFSTAGQVLCQIKAHAESRTALLFQRSTVTVHPSDKTFVRKPKWTFHPKLTALVVTNEVRSGKTLLSWPYTTMLAKSINMEILLATNDVIVLSLVSSTEQPT